MVVDGVAPEVVLDERPLQLTQALPEGTLKKTLQACNEGPFTRSTFSIGHRGAPLRYPEHTRESYLAAARQGAGALECDAVMTRDGTLPRLTGQGELLHKRSRG